MYVNSIVFPVVMRRKGEFTVDEILKDVIASGFAILDRAKVRSYLERQANKRYGCIKRAGPSTYRAELNTYALEELRWLADADDRLLDTIQRVVVLCDGDRQKAMRILEQMSDSV